MHAVDGKMMNRHYKALRQVKWFDDNVSNDDVRKLIRIMKDIRRRFLELQPIMPWTIELLVSH